MAGKTIVDKKRILITGDVIVDQNIYEGLRFSPTSAAPQGSHIVKTLGGAKLIYDISRALAADGRADVALGVAAASANDIPSYMHSYALWGPFPATQAKAKEKARVWRAARALGYSAVPPGAAAPALKPAPGIAGKNAIAVFDDGGLGFRASRQLWADVLDKKNSPGLIVLKMAEPVLRGDLWYALASQYRDRLVVVASADILRQSEAMIPEAGSWERTVEYVEKELGQNSSIRDLLQCRHLIITFQSDGALWFDNAPHSPCCRLIFDPRYLSGGWEKTIPGAVFGTGSCFTAGLVHHLIEGCDGENIETGICAGLAAMRTLLEEGHGPHTDAKGRPAESTPQFPLEKIVAVIRGDGQQLTRGYGIVSPVIENTARGADAAPCAPWTIIEGSIPRDLRRPLYGQARLLARKGLPALQNIPHAKFGLLTTVDRDEIESLNSIKKLIEQYMQGSASKPLSIGVFGPPGAGKSFGIKQIALGAGIQEKNILEYNLSQFSDPSQLIGAFHTVRDAAVQGTVPLVFWDEFDSKELVWLQYLLAPMQDGKFLEGQLSHPIGKCIFVFAGGTSYTMERFSPPEGKSEKEIRTFENFKLKKGPDFVSRLRGYINVLGPNQRQAYDSAAGSWKNDETDISFPLRRAILLRSVMRLGNKDGIQIDDGMLNAFLKIPQYRHGARSLETIIDLTRGPEKKPLLRSNLPPADQMSIHVEYADFLQLVDENMAFKSKCKELAPFIHAFYRALSKKNKWPFKYDCDYGQLPEDIKADNIAAAYRIASVLACAGLRIAPKPKGRTAGLPEKIIRNIMEENLELLAQAEHDGWMDFKNENGWVYGKDRDDAKKIHNCLVPYAQLHEQDKQKDRDNVLNYGKIAALAGYTIILEKAPPAKKK